MGILFPSKKEILKTKLGVTEGELFLINKLQEFLDDSYEIYFQPLLNGDKPDIIILRKNGGILIVEVKDWHLSNYIIDNNANFRLRKNNMYIKSPLQQVIEYKNNICELYMRILEDYSVKKNQIKQVVQVAVYFHNETSNSLRDLRNLVNINSNIWGRDDIKKTEIEALMRNTRINGSSVYFNNALYKESRRVLQSSFQLYSNRIGITLDKGQKNNEEFNKYADKLFDVYNEKKQLEEEESKSQQESFNFTEEEVIMDKEIMSLSLGECIQAVATSKKEIEEKNLQIKKQEEEVKELKNSLEMVIDNRDLKKEIKLLTRKINEVESNIKEENEKLKLYLVEIKKENVELKKIISSLEKKISVYDPNAIVKQIIENQSNISNTLKGGIVENLTKHIEGLFLNFEQKLKVINERTEVIEKESKKEMEELLAGKKGNVDILLEDINI